LCLLFLAARADVRTGKVSNRLIVQGLFLGFIRNLGECGWNGSFHFLLQVSVPVFMFYLFYLMHALGAGDIKLFSVVSSCIGLRGLVNVIVYSFLVGAVFSIVLLARNKNLYSRLAYFSNYVRTALYTKSIIKYDHESDGKKNFIHFSVAVFFGFVIYLGGV